MPTDIELLRFRVQLRAMRREWSLAIEETDELARVFPTLYMAQSFAAMSYSSLLQDDDALHAASLALMDSPTSEAFLLRAQVRPWADIEGRRSDIQSALELDPNSLRALRELGEIEARKGDSQAAIDAYSRLLQQAPDGRAHIEALVLRGIEWMMLGKSQAARKDFEAALEPKPSARVYNSLCWHLALANVALKRALNYCNLAIEIEPQSASYIDSKGTVLLRLGRWEESIKAFDAALKLEPTLLNSLYGRGIARQSRCNCEAGIMDMRNALQANPTIQREFERLGFTVPFPPSPEPIKRSRKRADY